MSIQALSSAGLSPNFQSTSNLSIVQTSLQSLQRSLGVGNLAAAQTTYTQLQAASQSLAKAGGASAPTAQTTTDLATLGAALDKGDLTASRTALSNVQKDLANVNSLAITAAVDAANQAVQQIDALLGLSADSSTSSSLDALLGTSSSANPDIAAQTTSILGNVYGNHTPASATSSASATGTNVNVSA